GLGGRQGELHAAGGARPELAPAGLVMPSEATLAGDPVRGFGRDVRVAVRAADEGAADPHVVAQEALRLGPAGPWVRGLLLGLHRLLLTLARRVYPSLSHGERFTASPIA